MLSPVRAIVIKLQIVLFQQKEAEISDAEKGKDDFDAFLKENNIDFKYAKSKVARFVATLKRDKD